MLTFILLHILSHKRKTTNAALGIHKDHFLLNKSDHLVHITTANGRNWRVSEVLLIEDCVHHDSSSAKIKPFWARPSPSFRFHQKSRALERCTWKHRWWPACSSCPRGSRWHSCWRAYSPTGWWPRQCQQCQGTWTQGTNDSDVIISIVPQNYTTAGQEIKKS